MRANLDERFDDHAEFWAQAKYVLYTHEPNTREEHRILISTDNKDDNKREEVNTRREKKICENGKEGWDAEWQRIEKHKEENRRNAVTNRRTWVREPPGTNSTKMQIALGDRSVP